MTDSISLSEADIPVVAFTPSTSSTIMDQPLNEIRAFDGASSPLRTHVSEFDSKPLQSPNIPPPTLTQSSDITSPHPNNNSASDSSDGSPSSSQPHTSFDDLSHTLTTLQSNITGSSDLNENTGNESSDPRKSHSGDETDQDPLVQKAPTPDVDDPESRVHVSLNITANGEEYNIPLPEIMIDNLSGMKSDLEVSTIRPLKEPVSLDAVSERLRVPTGTLNPSVFSNSSAGGTPRSDTPGILSDSSDDDASNSTGATTPDSRPSTPLPRQYQRREYTWSHDPKEFIRKQSPAADEWKRQKESEGCQNAAIDKLMRMVGLEEVKWQMLGIRDKVETSLLQGVDIANQRFNVVFQGNPGTGKTTVARIYAEFLCSVGLLKSAQLYETSGAKLSSAGPANAEKIISKLIHKGGGVLFVDESYQLVSPQAGGNGPSVLDIILTEMENNIGKLAVIFAGYKKEMETFFEHNDGLASRVPYIINFEDLDDVDLWTIMCDLIERRYHGRMNVASGMGGLYMRVLIRRLGRGRGIRGFGNARSVENMLQKIGERQARRLKKEQRDHRNGSLEDEPDIFLFTKEDLIGPAPDIAFKSEAWEKLQNMTGLEEVKEAAKCMIDMIITNYNRELDELKPFEFSLNRVFCGAPGTGKTTVAALYGRILADIGLLSTGEVITKNPCDFIGQCLGKSEANTRSILRASLGKVLIVDEAYQLGPGSSKGGGTNGQHDSYKEAVIDTIVAEVQSVPGDDRCVLFLGYEDGILDMFQNVNPGLARRFAIENRFRFQDYSAPQLMDILKLKVKERHLTPTPDAYAVADMMLVRAKMRPNFSNGGDVDILLQRAIENYQKRQSLVPINERESSGVLTPEDFDPNHERVKNAVTNCREQLQGKVTEDIIKMFEGKLQDAQLAQQWNRDPRDVVPTNFIFAGNPGTGKSTTARLMGEIYYNLGFLATTDVIECTASDLIGRYVGHTAPQTQSMLEKGLGKVLFVDEAYRLLEGQYAVEAVNELISILGSPKYKRKIIVILAGYVGEMTALRHRYPSLSAIFPETINFRNLTSEECLDILERTLTGHKISAPCLTDKQSVQYKQLRNLLDIPQVFFTWGNANEALRLADEMAMVAMKAASAESGSEASESGNKTLSITFKQCEECIRAMIQSHHSKNGGDLGEGKTKLPRWSKSESTTSKQAPPETPGGLSLNQDCSRSNPSPPQETAEASATASAPITNVHRSACAEVGSSRPVNIDSVTRLCQKLSADTTSAASQSISNPISVTELRMHAPNEVAELVDKPREAQEPLPEATDIETDTILRTANPPSLIHQEPKPSIGDQRVDTSELTSVTNVLEPEQGLPEELHRSEGHSLVDQISSLDIEHLSITAPSIRLEDNDMTRHASVTSLSTQSATESRGRHFLRAPPSQESFRSRSRSRIRALSNNVKTKLEMGSRNVVEKVERATRSIKNRVGQKKYLGERLEAVVTRTRPGTCVNGFEWVEQGDGSWECAGGEHRLPA